MFILEQFIAEWDLFGKSFTVLLRREIYLILGRNSRIVLEYMLLKLFEKVFYQGKL